MGWGRDQIERRQLLALALERHRPRPSEPFACPYLPGREAQHVHVVPTPLGPGVLHALMDLNFRRTGQVFYRTACAGCAECRSLRVPVAPFQPNRSQRRCLAGNQDLSIEIGPLEPSEEKLALYQLYLSVRHDGTMSGSREEFEQFLYASPVQTVEMRYRLQGRLVALSVVDVEPEALSAVYCFFDPSLARRSLGTFNVLTLIAECRRRAVPHAYLGYWVPGSRAMDYKTRFRPCEVLTTEGAWERL